MAQENSVDNADICNNQRMEIALSFTMEINTEHTDVKRSIVRIEKVDEESSATETAFVGLRLMRNECSGFIVAQENSVMERFNLETIEFGDQHKRLENDIPVWTIEFKRRTASMWT